MVLVVFVDHAIPGQTVRVRITRKKSQFAEARVVRLLAQSPAYTLPFCPHFGVCGGCQWQDLAYEEQLHWKRVQVQECLRHLGGLRPEIILPTVASPEQRYYRNKMGFTFAPLSGLPAKDRAGGKILIRQRLRLRIARKGLLRPDLRFGALLSAIPQSPALVQEARRWCGNQRSTRLQP